MNGLDDPAFGKAGTLKMHMLTTAVIHVAGDGKTAKGIWYSPGVLSEGRGGRYMSAWIYETYSQDFVKEDGVWRNWHRCLSTDFMTPPNKSWTSAYDTGIGQDEISRIGGILDSTKTGQFKPVTGQGQGPVPGTQGQPPGGQGPGSTGCGPGARVQGQPGPPQDASKDIKMVAYQSWTPATLPQYKPKPPVPYKTFAETFSYVPPMPDDLKEKLEKEGMMY